MSSFQALTKHPISGEWLIVEWLDDYFGGHEYGVRFPDGHIYDPRQYKMEIKDERKD